ncbi:MAG: aminotransferase class I/II-fold pyridoxal phosphate-dependent enzyme [Spirochaetales bacterium]|nr:aminotransferase class I/II-fold pyridoxal phosphate-dependent enzyme [Spirochaetales bacterium]
MDAFTINPLERARRSYEVAGGLINLVDSDFARAGLVWPAELYRSAWDAWRAEPAYRPTGSGSPGAREAVAVFLSEDGAPIEADEVVLTAGSSVSYHLLFSLFRDRALGRTSHRGNGVSDAATVALPIPGYPLFDGLLNAVGVRPTWYHCGPEDDFLPDPQEIERLVGTSEAGPTAALVMISPNHPAGVTYPERIIADIIDICAEADVPVLFDEVFSLYRCGDLPSSIVRRTGTASSAHGGVRSRYDYPTVHLNGVSKLCAAPEVKLGWIAVRGGTRPRRLELVDELDTRHDDYLTLSGFAEAAAAPFLTDPRAHRRRREFRETVNARRSRLIRHLSTVDGWEVRETDSGIHIPVQLDPVYASRTFGTLDDEQIAVELVERAGIYLHPGYLYGFDRSHFGGGLWFIVTSLADEALVGEATARLRAL